MNYKIKKINHLHVIDKNYKIIFITIFLLVTYFTGYFTPYLKNFSGYDVLRAFIITVPMVIILRKKFVYDKIAVSLLIITVYTLFSSFVTYCRYNYFPVESVKFAISSAGYLYAYNIVKTSDDLKCLSKGYITLLTFTIMLIVAANYLGFDNIRPAYNGIEVNFGPHGVNITKNFIFFGFCAMPFLLFNSVKRKNYIIIAVIMFSIMYILLGQKRSALYSSAVAIIFYIYLVRYHLRASIIKYLAYLLILTSVLFLVNLDQILNSFLARSERHSAVFVHNSENLESEARYFETIRTIKDYDDRKVFEIVFGSGFKSESFRYKTERMIHSDYIMFLDGGGIFGLILYLFVYFRIINKSYTIRKVFYYDKIANILSSSVLAVTLVALIMAIAGFSHGIDARMLYLVYVGAVFSFLKNNYANPNAYSQRKFTFL